MIAQRSSNQFLEFWNLLEMTADAIEQAREIELRKFNISVVQSKVLISLWIMDHDPTISEISHWLFREQSSTSCIMDKMEQLGMVRRYRDSKKKSITRIALTEKGQEEFHNVVSRESLLKVLSVLSREECLRLRKYFSTMLNHAMEDAEIHHSPIYAQLMVSNILKLAGDNSQGMDMALSHQIEGVDHGHVLLDIIYSYCTPDQLFVWVYIDQTKYAISRAIARELREYDLSPSQSKILSTLSTLNYSPTLGELSRRIFREHNSVSDITDRMARKGLLTKYQDPVKKHLTRVSITENGKQVHLNSVKKVDLENILSSLNTEELEQVQTLLLKLFKKAVGVADLNTVNNQ